MIAFNVGGSTEKKIEELNLFSRMQKEKVGQNSDLNPTHFQFLFEGQKSQASKGN